MKVGRWQPLLATLEIFCHFNYSSQKKTNRIKKGEGTHLGKPLMSHVQSIAKPSDHQDQLSQGAQTILWWEPAHGLILLAHLLFSVELLLNAVTRLWVVRAASVLTAKRLRENGASLYGSRRQFNFEILNTWRYLNAQRLELAVVPLGCWYTIYLPNIRFFLIFWSLL